MKFCGCSEGSDVLPAEHALKLGKIQGLLEAFAFFNSEADHGCVFEFDAIEKIVSVETTVNNHLQEISGVKSGSLRLNFLSDAEQELQNVLGRWMFNRQSAQGDFAPKHEQERSVADLVALMWEVSRPIAVYKVEFHPLKWYECSWDDFALEGQNQVFFLHLGVSD